MALSKEKKTQVSKIRKFMSSRDFYSILQGVELLSALDDPEIWTVFTNGLSVSSLGAIELGKGELKKRVTPHHRIRAALHMAVRAGLLDSCATLDLSERLTMMEQSNPAEDLHLLHELEHFVKVV